MGKLMIWVVTIFGLTPAVALACMSLLLLILGDLGGPPGTKTFYSKAYLTSGPVRIEFTPEYWTAGLLLLGSVLIVVGIAAILRPQAGA